MKTTPTPREGTMSHVLVVWILAGWVVASALATPLLSALCRLGATRYPEWPTSRRGGVFLCPAQSHDSRSTPNGPRRRPDRRHPRLRGVQAPELPDQQVQAQQPGPHRAAEVLQVVPPAHVPPRDPIGRIHRGP